MYNLWKILLTNGLTALASFVVSFMILVVSHYYSLGLFSIIIAPLMGGFMAAYMVLFLLEGGELLYLAQTYWHTLLLGLTVALVAAVGFVCAISQHYLFF
ncbi:MAG: hypothetical protein WGN25_17480 [Candidatus Electrothrix sp. GW3-4]|uniref:hypothetical protein n=1 Tax=Candidatus Electrothrix sp. GW3-4 TaxID=3126740 RepID=UPI0030D3CC19